MAAMAATDRITMTMCELDRFKVIQAVADDLLKPSRAAQRLGLMKQQTRRLILATHATQSASHAATQHCL